LAEENCSDGCLKKGWIEETASGGAFQWEINRQPPKLDQALPVACAQKA